MSYVSPVPPSSTDQVYVSHAVTAVEFSVLILTVMSIVSKFVQPVSGFVYVYVIVFGPVNAVDVSNNPAASTPDPLKIP